VKSEGTSHNFTLQLAWAAGLFDGEGCSSARRQKRKAKALRIQASVSQSSHSAEVVPSVLVRFQRAVGGMGSIGAAYLDERSGTFAYQWRAGSFEEAQAVIALLWANLGAVKRAQAADAFGRFRAQYETIRPVYRTPTRARRLSVSLRGPAASTREQRLAWAAGLFDGEGSTELHTRRTLARTWFSLRSRVSQCDAHGVPEVLQRFQAVVGCGRIDGPTSGEGYENAYKWDAGADDTLRVLPMIWPWLGTVKRVQAIDVIKTVDALPVLRRHPWRDEARRFTQLHTETSSSSFPI
jgi:hypothetical protein